VTNNPWYISFRHSRIVLFGFFTAAISLGSCRLQNRDLKTKDISRLDYKVSGCFAFEQSMLTIYEKNGHVMARLFTNNKTKQVAQLNAAQVEAFNSFIEKVKSLKEDSTCISTTTHSFTIYSTDGTVQKVNKGCGGEPDFEELKDNLFRLK
jgi:hypothetical protein